MFRKKHFKTILLTLFVVGGFVALGFAGSTTLKPSQPAPGPATVGMETPMVPANFSELAEKVRPGVVNIQVVKKVQNAGVGMPNFPGNPFGDRNPFGDFFGPFFDRPLRQFSLGVLPTCPVISGGRSCIAILTPQRSAFRDAKVN